MSVAIIGDEFMNNTVKDHISGFMLDNPMITKNDLILYRDSLDLIINEISGDVLHDLTTDIVYQRYLGVLDGIELMNNFYLFYLSNFSDGLVVMGE